MADSFCTKCASWQESFVKAGEEPIEGNRFPNWVVVKASADQGCSLCQIVYQSRNYDSDVSDPEGSSPIVVDITKATAMFSLLVSCESNGIFFRLPTIVDESDARQFDDYKARCKDILDPTAPGNLKKIAYMASEWLQKYRQNHCRCNASHNADEERILPTRLIDVGLDTQQPKLISPDRDLLDLEYLILSYAWGPVANFAKTTSSNLQVMHQSLPWDALPKTVRDAVLLTRRLGIRYLWVDALCILQSEGCDDTEHIKDWSYEAERFGHYYQNALLTISATGAMSSHEGLFLPRSDLVSSPKSVKVQHIDLTLRSFVPSWKSEMRFPPLASRGWALQERFLSKRILHFGPNLILWECQELRASELDPTGLDPRGPDERQGFSSSNFLSIFQTLNNEDIPLNRLMDQWMKFISVYSRAEFSCYSDRLPALSGIATIIQKRIKQRYIAGLWEPVFTLGLMWVSGKPTETKKRETCEQQLNVPSWSWASNKHRVFFTDPISWKTMCQIVECDVKSKGSETSGQLLSWRLRLWGSFSKLDLSQMGFERHRKTRVNLFESFHGSGPTYLYLDNFTGSKIPYTSCPCLLVGVEEGIDRDMEDDGDMIAHALVLESTGQSSDSVEQYRRIGTLDIRFRDWMIGVQDERTIELR
ncbi:hypothetical protein NW752_009434 [Fusarium irregulare]|uniref:Heterokaryon incompatibility domain-containing protein n=1 Tax=Fusarium irregulare TaxID=2494466 RepID=A0A9W8PDP8_9HYPO|nr:hypothetical protein NW766_012712 [Fusarium irregulare]KAJ4009137.1 hypothetical protein NW752_009434 [Fusarium irregulare]